VISMARGAYTALLCLLLPFALGRLAWRSRREPGYARDLGERFGRYGDAPPAEPLIWLHAVSVGETRAAEPLVRVLQARYPDHRILLTHMTPTGRRTGESLFGEDLLRMYLPYDFPGAVGRFLDHFKPRIGLLMETEIWPNVIAASKQRKVPLFLVNARLSEKSYRGYRRFDALVRETLGALSGVAAQTAADAGRLRSLGARNVTVSGNIKFDMAPPLEQLARGRSWRESYGPRSVLLAASTREGEEALVLEAYSDLPGNPLLLLVPRHPQRFDEVAALLEKRGVRYQRRSTAATVSPDTQVLLGDSMGEMAAYYAACDLAFVGGSLLPFGGQNFIEGCAVGTPVLLGPHTYNFKEAAERAISSGAALRIGSPSELAREATRLLADDAGRAQMAQRGLQFSEAHQGATQKAVSMIEGALARNTKR
jgi:3-deoxy-D-manno-octulosonic-acid transferase